MKILLNLLPEERRASNQRKLRFRFLVWQLFLLFVLELFFVTILAGIWFILDFQLKTVQAEDQSYASGFAGQKTLNRYEDAFRSTNDLVDTVGKIDTAHFSFTTVFLLLKDTVPPGIALTGLTTKNTSIHLVGQALQRDDILAFRDKLGSSDCLQNVNVPLSDLFSQKNVVFQLDFDIKPACLRKK